MNAHHIGNELRELSRPYERVLYFEYDPIGNVFYDQTGRRMDSILEVITPNDLYLFRQDPGNCCFPCRNDSRIMCEVDVNE